MGSLNLLGQKTKFLKMVLLFGALVIVDQISKGMISQPIFNSGFFLGSLQWASAFYRIFCTVALLGISILVISLIQFLTWQTLPSLSAALMCLEAGIVGNGIDKLRFGAVRDFIIISLFHPSLILNFADLFQWAGIIAILILIWTNPSKLWPKENMRNRLLVFPASQFRMTGVLLLIASLIAVGNFVLMIAYLKSNQIVFNFEETSICFGLSLLFTYCVIFIFGMLWSNRIYGPFRAIERYLRGRNSANRSEVKVRISDENEAIREILILLKKMDENRK